MGLKEAELYENFLDTLIEVGLDQGQVIGVLEEWKNFPTLLNINFRGLPSPLATPVENSVQANALDLVYFHDFKNFDLMF